MITLSLRIRNLYFHTRHNLLISFPILMQCSFRIPVISQSIPDPDQVSHSNLKLSHRFEIYVHNKTAEGKLGVTKENVNVIREKFDHFLLHESA